MSECIIRKCQVQDFEAVFDLLHQLWPGKEFHQEVLFKLFKRGLDSIHEEYYCAEKNGRVVGFCSIWFRESIRLEGWGGYIDELIVDKSLRRQSIGTELLSEVLARAKHKGCKRVDVESGLSRVQASEFYLKMGFEKHASFFWKAL